MRLHNDIKLAISIVYNPVQHDRMKHVRFDRCFIKSELDNETISLSYVPTTYEEVDILTKTLSKPSFESSVCKLGKNVGYKRHLTIDMISGTIVKNP